MKFKFAALLACAIASPVLGAIIGTNPPPSPITDARIAALPPAQQVPWKLYLDRSRSRMQADKDFLRAEMKRDDVKKETFPHTWRSTKGISLDKGDAWYAGDDARHIADIIVSFQTPAGGWSKNLDMTRFSRAPGESFAADNEPTKQSPSDNDLAADRDWNYVGTFDNNATTTQLRFLGRVISADHGDTMAFRRSFLRGLDYIFNAQFPNGGWPQVWPLQGGYHDEITYNDDAMANVLELLHDVAAGTNEFAFVSPDVRAKANDSFQRGIRCVLATQVIENGQRSAWCQQYDALTLQPASARNYEMPSLASAESARLMQILMQLPNPDADTIAAVRGVAAWFEKTKIEGKAYKPVKGKGRELIDVPGAGPLWARYYQIGTDKPIFGDRDKTIHDEVSEISVERRNGYAWYRDTPKRMLEHYTHWSKKHSR
ncbi:MAG TPA: pectate lyase [Verrucomicrobiae bacterium]|nr:pectate lyase [Verrucomicrobiae bacterium]